MEKKYLPVEKDQMVQNIKKLISIVEEIETSMNDETQLWRKEKGA